MKFIQNMKPVYTNARSTLYKAQWNNNTVAVKYIPQRMCVMENIVTELEVLQTLQGLNHVVRYIDAIENEKDVYIIMEWINGMNLKEYVNQLEKPLTEQKVKELVYPLVETLYHCHEMNMIYGDVKPENIMIEPSGTVKLIDFGCTRKIGTVKDTYLGTPLYFAPEMFYQVCLPQYDTWGVGMIMYYLACGKHPFVKTPPVDMTSLKNMVHHTPLDFEDPVWSHWTEEGIYLLLQLLEKDSFKRLNMAAVYHHKWFDSVSRADV